MECLFGLIFREKTHVNRQVSQTFSPVRTIVSGIWIVANCFFSFVRIGIFRVKKTMIIYDNIVLIYDNK